MCVADNGVGCLFAESGSPTATIGCDGDQLNLSKQQFIRDVIAHYSLGDRQIDFVSCKEAAFATFAEGPTARTRHYRIQYPVMVGTRIGEYLAPITHELSHVYQLEKAGSYARLRDSYEIKKIELGADFLTGVIFRELQTVSTLDQFQQNLKLIGKYRESTLDAHGTPSQRVAAFRFGYFYKDQDNTHTIGEISQDFMDNIYGDVVRL
jgi:hypothetical protein